MSGGSLHVVMDGKPSSRASVLDLTLASLSLVCHERALILLSSIAFPLRFRTQNAVLVLRIAWNRTWLSNGRRPNTSEPCELCHFWQGEMKPFS